MTGVPDGFMELAAGLGDSRFIAELGAGTDPDQALAETMSRLREKAAKLDERAEMLRKLVAAHDPVRLIGLIASGVGFRLTDDGSEDTSAHEFGDAAKVEYLAGLALTGPPGNAEVDEQAVERAVRLTGEVFDSAGAQMLVDSVSAIGNQQPGIQQARFFFQFEQLLDRMTGFHAHLQEIGDEVFEPHRSFYLQHLDFCPNDAIRLVGAHRVWINQEFAKAWSAREYAAKSSDSAEMRKAHSRIGEVVEASYVLTPELLARNSGTPIAQIEAMLSKMSVELGCQPDFRVPLDANKARAYPFIRLGDGRYLAPVLWLLPQAAYDWIEAQIRSDPSWPLASAYRDHRRDAAERLVRRSLEDVFGAQAVFGNQHYDSSGGHGEVDCLVAGHVPIIVEAKSHALTDKVRRDWQQHVPEGAERVARKSAEQTRRASSYIAEEGGRSFAESHGGNLARVLPDDVADPVEIAITLERMDPLAMAAEKLSGGRGSSVWFTNIGDFLMVRDILDDPASFLHYATTRSRLCELGANVYAESDALGAYLEDRLKSEFDKARQGGAHKQQIIDTNSADINRYYRFRDSGFDLDIDKPGTGVPPEIVEALSACARAGGYSRDWAAVVAAVLGAPPDVWGKWKRFLKNHRYQHPFHLPCGEASIVSSEALDGAELRRGDTLQLAVPAETRGVRTKAAANPGRTKHLP